MVRILKTKKSTSKHDGKEFVSLKIQGDAEVAQSQQTGKFYLTAKTAWLATTFDEQTAEALVGTELPGKVVKVPSEPYDFTNDAGETLTLSHRYEYQMDEQAAIESKMIEQHEVEELVHDLMGA